MLLLALAACAMPALAQEVTTEFDESVDFSKFKTFTIRDGEVKSPSPALSGELTKKRVETEPNPSKLAGTLDGMVNKVIKEYPPKK